MLNRATTPPTPGPITIIDGGRASAALRTRFKALIQSPLRAGILRYLGSRPHQSYDVESLRSLVQYRGRVSLSSSSAIVGTEPL